MRKSHVMAYYNAGLQVLRASERPKNIKRLQEIRDAADNMPAVQAIKTQLSDIEANNRGSGLPMQPGLQIVIVQGGDRPPRTIGPAPAIDVTPNDKSTG
jgi:hypothetical protein